METLENDVTSLSVRNEKIFVYIPRCFVTSQNEGEDLCPILENIINPSVSFIYIRATMSVSFIRLFAGKSSIVLARMIRDSKSRRFHVLLSCLSATTAALLSLTN